MRNGARAWRHWPSGRGREMRTSRGRLRGRSAIGPLQSFVWTAGACQGHRVADSAHVPRPGLRPALLLYFAASATRRPWPETLAVFAAGQTSSAARQAVPGGGDFCGDEKRRPAVGARSALRRLTRRSCSNAESAANAVSSATRPRGEHRSGVDAQRRPPQHEVLPGAACRAALKPHRSGLFVTCLAPAACGRWWPGAG